MKIGIVCYPTYGGSGIVATELGLELARKGHHVHFISYALPTRLNTFQDNVFFHDVEIPNYPLFEFHLYTLALVGKIIDVVKYEKIDILHVHYAIPHAVSGYLANQILQKDYSLKLVTTLHGTDITLLGLEPGFHPIIKFSLEHSDRITAVSSFLREKTIQHFNTGKEIDVIPNFVNTSLYNRFAQPGLKKNIAPNDEKIFIHISNFRTVKRVCDVIKVFNEVNKQIPSKLLLVGDGPDRIPAENLARELGIQNHIKFLGKQTSLVELLSVSDVFLLPSQSESFGLSALEAMSCGVPVIGSNIGGIPEVVEHNETGFVAELGDVKRMAKYALELLQNSKKWHIFSSNARKRAVELFDTNLIVPKYETLYNELLNS
ncbi:MAG: N-acetyl-alpha-D-glucosaminyl L-malate synthase BshA [Bacteroidetes bacterium]|nr:MAG: N-acetyl-alpha-D-glucosaminyl L-malate synthase BshA [Bacteroidota bacterium]